MNELMLPFPDSYSDETLVELSERKIQAAEKSLQMISTAAGHLHDLIHNKTLRVRDRQSVVGVIAGHVKDLQSYLGSAADLEQKAHWEQNQVRILNTEIERLRAVMGAGVSNELVGARLLVIEKLISRWWRSCGFSACTVSFSAAYSTSEVRVEFRCHLINEDCDVDHFFDDRTAEAVEQERQAALETLCHSVDICGKGNCRVVCDTTRSRDHLMSLILNKFPQARIWKYHGACHRNVAELRQIEALIPFQSTPEEV